MRTSEVVSLLVVLVVGVARAWPQYPGVGGGGASVDQQQQSAAVAETVPGFTPSQSEECAQYHDCVLWQLCVDGEINTSGIGLLNLRTPEKVPEGYPGVLCSGVGKLCCRIPDAILSAQTGEVAGGIGGGTIVEQVSGGGGEQVSGGVASSCPELHDCVPRYLCHDGEINTSGVGLIDKRIRPISCTNPDYPTVDAVCCKLPSCSPGDQCVVHPDACDGTLVTDHTGRYEDCFTGPDTPPGVCCTPPVPTPLETCPGTRVCVANNQCSAQGTVVTDGSGIIDIRLHHICYLDAAGTTGVCCQPPPPLDVCPGGGSQECVPEGACLGEITLSPYGVYQDCYLDGQLSPGVCCTPPPPLTSCSADGSQTCVPSNNCLGEITLDANGEYQECYTDSSLTTTGVCCTPPPPVSSCSTDNTQVCRASGTCGNSVTVDINGDPVACYLDGGGVGHCCSAPPILDSCPHQSVCLPEILCQGELLHINGTFIPYGNSGSWSECLLSGTGNSIPGVCCQNPTTPPPPDPLLVAAETCGFRNYGLNTRIKNDNLLHYQANFAEFPWQAIIFFTNFTFKCGGSLIGDRWLLTAAHCVDGINANDLRVRLGEWQVDVYNETLQYYDTYVKKITIHEAFNPANVHNDIAVVELTEPIKFQYHINTICLPAYGQVAPEGSRCYATGWGKDAFDGGEYQVILKKVEVPVVSPNNCQSLLRKTRLGYYFILDKSFMCAGGEVNKDACEGDGGGPLACQDPATGNYFLAGITAWGIGCGQKDVPGVYVDVQYFREWIDGIIAGEQQQQQQQQQNTGGYSRK